MLDPDGHLSVADIANYYVGGMGGELRLLVEEHCFTCSECIGKLSMAAAVGNAIEEIEEKGDSSHQERLHAIPADLVKRITKGIDGEEQS